MGLPETDCYDLEIGRGPAMNNLAAPPIVNRNTTETPNQREHRNPTLYIVASQLNSWTPVMHGNQHRHDRKTRSPAPATHGEEIGQPNVNDEKHRRRPYH